MTTPPPSSPKPQSRHFPRPFLSLLVALIAIIYTLWTTRPLSVLHFISLSQFNWTASTTDIPISTVSVLLKSLLSGTAPPLPGLPDPSDTVSVQRVRDALNANRLKTLRKLCRRRRCRVNNQDPNHGLTALHLAALSGDNALTDYLESRGALHLPDHAQRLPRNLSFSAFSSNSKKWARAAGRHDCDFPVIDYSANPNRARQEISRLVSEGEPVLIRGALQSIAPDLLSWSADSFIRQHGENSVTVGAVPYASAFNLSTKQMTLREYYQRFVQTDSTAPLYVFSKGPAVCAAGYAALVRLIEDAFPVPQLIVHPRHTGAVDGMHFFLGRQGSGAPFHLHADALNAAVSGTKQWYVYTPRASLYSRMPIKRWVEEDLPGIPEEHRPMQCTQRAGDVVYVPLDWGHAVMNMEENTFGFALEVLNTRDTLLNIAGKGRLA